MKQEKRETRSLCPLAGFAECKGESCMLWDNNWQVCSLSSGSLYSGVRAAVCDAAVEMMAAASQVMMFEEGPGSPIDPAKAGPLPRREASPLRHCGGEAFGEAGA